MLQFKGLVTRNSNGTIELQPDNPAGIQAPNALLAGDAVEVTIENFGTTLKAPAPEPEPEVVQVKKPKK